MKQNHKGKRGKRMVKINELEKIDNQEETEKEYRNSGLVDTEDCKDQRYM
jgi:hypothetical protein